MPEPRIEAEFIVCVRERCATSRGTVAPGRAGTTWLDEPSGIRSRTVPVLLEGRQRYEHLPAASLRWEGFTGRALSEAELSALVGRLVAATNAAEEGTAEAVLERRLERYGLLSIYEVQGGGFMAGLTGGGREIAERHRPPGPTDAELRASLGQNVDAQDAVAAALWNLLTDAGVVSRTPVRRGRFSWEAPPETVAMVDRALARVMETFGHQVAR